jgi:hypothetical protein
MIRKIYSAVYILILIMLIFIYIMIWTKCCTWLYKQRTDYTSSTLQVLRIADASSLHTINL